MAKHRASEFDTRINIQYKTDSRNEFNEKVKTWKDLTTLWAKQLSGSGDEKVQGGIDQNYKQKKFLIRHYPVIDEAMRIILDNKVYNITNVEKLEKRRYQEITCEQTAEKPA